MRLLVVFAGFAFAVPAAAAAPCPALAEQRMRLAAEYQMNAAVIGDWKAIARRRRDRRRIERVGRTAANVALGVLLPFPLGAAASLGARGAESAITGKPLVPRPRPTTSASVEALRARQSVIVARLGRSERATGCGFRGAYQPGRT